VPEGQVQAPATHVWPPAQVVPHAPQFALSLLRSTQPPLHAERPVAQAAAHLPAEQTWPAAHAVPQAPQLATSVETSTHLPPHVIVPVGHAQALLVQT
jgi:hypothetical protein